MLLEVEGIALCTAWGSTCFGDSCSGSGRIDRKKLVGIEVGRFVDKLLVLSLPTPLVERDRPGFVGVSCDSRSGWSWSFLLKIRQGQRAG